MVFEISIWRIIAAVVVYFAVGALWYSPVLFAKAWMKELGRKKEDMAGAQAAMITTFLAMVVLVLAETYLVQATMTEGIWGGAVLGLILWVGFAATTGLINNSFQGASKKLYAIDQGYHLLGIVLAGAILAS
ncbi:MAG: hypothetical protein JWN01_731 [Patescibacteria group bacterium]|nr:hypothetical protein [Patescibacteria group bacterium]